MALSPSGHVPLNEVTLAQMSDAEREFWVDFLELAEGAIEVAVESNQQKPYPLSPNFKERFKTAVRVYDGDKYCQVNQLRGIFDCRSIPLEPHH